MPKPRKPDHLRQRRNKQPEGAKLSSADEAQHNEVPLLPSRQSDTDGNPQTWHPMVVEWWESVWKSPMASEFLDADMKGGLYLLADLHQARWENRDHAGALSKIASEIRLQEVRFGLSPIDRSRLRWTIEQGETAAEKTEARRSRSPKMPSATDDPRDVLKLA